MKTIHGGVVSPRCDELHKQLVCDQQEVVDRSAEVQHNNCSNVDLLGVGRSYNCVFCKRGFKTAQALGGHVNIHRKNKDRPSPTNAPNSHNSCSNKIICTDIADGGDEQNSFGSSLNRCYDQPQHQQSDTPAASPHSGNGSSSISIYNTPSNSHQEALIRDDPPRYCRNFFGDDDDYHMSLGSLQFGSAAHVQQDMENMGQLPNFPDEANLDLELRLGHD